jgi:hypothetical protein
MKLELLFLLVAGHALCDFALQSDTMSREKKRGSPTPLQKAVPWYWWLGAHSLIHGLSVWVVLRSLPLALAETVAHFVIDFGKCEGKYGLGTDQALHLTCKMIWLKAIAGGWLP